MAVNLSPVGGVAGQFFDNNGDPLVGGKLYTYAAGTTTPQVTYTSSSGAAPNSNPIILNAGGRVPSEIWLTDGLVYKFVLYSSTDQLIGSWDNIVGINSNFVNFVTSEEVQIATAGQTVFTLTTMQYQPGINNLVVYVDGVNQVEGGSYSFVETNSTTVTFTSGLHLGAVVKFVSAETVTTIGANAAQVAYEPAGSGAVTTTVQAKLRETVSVKNFGAVGDGVTDDTAAFALAFASGAKYIYCGESETYKINLVLAQPTSYRDFVLDLNGSTLTSDAGTILEIQRYANFVIQNGVFEGQLGVVDYGLKVGYGVQQSSSGLSLKNVRFNDFGTSCLHADKASYTTLENCLLYTYFGDAVSGTWFSFLDMFGRYVGFENCVNMTGCAIVHFKSTHFFCETNVTPETLVKLTDCSHFEFNECTFEPQNTCTTSQVLITSSATFSSDIHFTGCYWLGDINDARQADSIRTTGTVHRLRLIKNNFYIVDQAGGFYNLKIGSTGQSFEIWDCYQTSQYDDATRANMTILNSTSQELYNQNLGGLFLGNASAGKGLFVNKADGTVLNAGQFYYNDQWEVIVAGNAQLIFTAAGIRPYADDSKTSGSASLRWSNVYGVNFRPGDGTVIWTSGTGSPEGIVTAVVGSMYTRTDGGAGTTLYVKESGAGNTGWVAK